MKSLKSVKNPSDENHTIIFSTSSDGKLRAWDLNMNDVSMLWVTVFPPSLDETSIILLALV